MDTSENRKYALSVKSLFYKGKSGFARALDRMVFSFSIGAGLFLILSSRKSSRMPTIKCAAAAIVFMLFVYLLLVLINGRRLFKFEKELKSMTRESLIKRIMLLMKRDELLLLLGNSGFASTDTSVDCDIAVVQHFEPADEDCVFSILRERGQSSTPLSLFSVNGFTAGAKRQAELIGNVACISGVELPGFADLFGVTDRDVENEIIKQAAPPPKFRRAAGGKLVYPVEAKYVLTGFLFIALSFFMRSKLYMRLFGGAMISASVWVTGIRRLIAKPKNKGV